MLYVISKIQNVNVIIVLRDCMLHRFAFQFLSHEVDVGVDSLQSVSDDVMLFDIQKEHKDFKNLFRHLGIGYRQKIVVTSYRFRCS